ncbi:sporulation protein [Streptosporangium sp. 'caverna']|uniref:sporulation protein n=1 Tax=Streptosporangium sp. 'caverna' TaxID=2202249 RepID=UPI000D7D68C5|nr:sporulation protein [Streptosporangium sp. 'caverna']AWS42827.1 sporulation protein [Streptosporangium sp. 'caverna']
MVFKRMLGAFGVGAPSVDTVLATPRVQPGGSLRGEVRIKGGDFDADIEYVALGLVTQVESEHGEGEQIGLVEFFRTQVSGPFRLRTAEDRIVPFQLPVPWETPVTEIAGQRLRGMAMGVRTELAIAKAIDKGDMDPVEIEPTASQEAVLRAFSQLGFHFKSADLERGRIYGVSQQLPFFQEIEFYPPAQYSGQINEVELTFVANPAGLDVIVEADKRGGRYSSGTDAVGRFQLTHEQALQVDWAAEINSWVASLSQHHGGSHIAGHDPYGQYGGHHGGHHDSHHRHHGGGPGLGGIAAAGAAGVVGGFVAAEAIDEIGDFFEGEEAEEE